MMPRPIARDRAALLDELQQLRAYRARNVQLGLELGQILGPDYDGTDLRAIARELADLKRQIDQQHQTALDVMRERDRLRDDRDCEKRLRKDAEDRVTTLEEAIEKLMLQLSESDAGVAQSAEPQIFNLQDAGSTPRRLHHPDRDRAAAADTDLCSTCRHPAKNHLPGRCRKHGCGCGRFVATPP